MSEPVLIYGLNIKERLYFTPKEVAAIVRCTPRRITMLCQAGDIKARKHNSHWRIHWKDLLEYIGETKEEAIDRSRDYSPSS